jgi:hypothetical protein
MLDLAPYGLKWSIDPSNKDSITVPDNFKNLIFNTKTTAKGYEASLANGKKQTYVKGRALGEGSYGKVFECTSGDKTLIVKEIITKDDQDLKGIILECIIQIIVVKETEDTKYPEYNIVGPFAPRLYNFGYDITSGKGYIFAEKMHKTVRGLLEGWEKDTKDRGRDVAHVLLRTSVVLSELYNKFAFNHRDFKSDNCMYIRNEKGHIMPRIIDFGFSCIKYKNLTINAKPDYFKYCSLEGRDMSQFIYECVFYHLKASRTFLSTADALLTFKRDGAVCRILKNECGMGGWKKTYRFFNNKNENPNGHPGIVKRVCEAFIKGEDWSKHLAYPKQAQVPVPPKPLTPKPVPKPVTPKPKPVPKPVSFRKPCPNLKPNYNPKTRRCVKSCPKGKKRNSTFKCVKQSLRNTTRVSKKNIVITVEKGKACPPLKPNYNPKTKRCVKPCPSGKKRNSSFKCK